MRSYLSRFLNVSISIFYSIQIPNNLKKQVKLNAKGANGAHSLRKRSMISTEKVDANQLSSRRLVPLREKQAAAKIATAVNDGKAGQSAPDSSKHERLRGTHISESVLPMDVSGIHRELAAVEGAWTHLGDDIDGEAAGDRFGSSITLSGDGLTLAAVATSADGVNGVDSGHVRVFRRSSSAAPWIQLGGDIDGEATGDVDISGANGDVALSYDGSILAVGAQLNDGDTGVADDNRGHVRVYQWDNTSWTQMGADIDGEAGGDSSGSAVALSSDGLTLAVGSPIANDGNGSFSGQVRVYGYDFQNDTWIQLGSDINGEANLDFSGSSVDLSGDGFILAVGAWGNDGVNGNSNGHVRVYGYDFDNDTWIQVGLDIDGEAIGDQSGWSVALSNTVVSGLVLAVGAISNDGGNANSDNRGHVRVYRWTGTDFNNGNWIQLGEDIDGEAPDNRSGISVDLSGDETSGVLILAVGADINDAGNASDDNRGHVRVYFFDVSNDNHWHQLGSDIDGEAAGDFSGKSIALSYDGSTLAVGSPLNDGINGINSGHVRTFQFVVSKRVMSSMYYSGSATPTIRFFPNFLSTFDNTI